MSASPLMASEDRREEPPKKELVHKTKLIQFLGRTTPIILQNDNGPCPLLAICNVLLLKNNFDLSPDTAEVSQEKLLSLVADRLIDSNSNVNNKDAEYVENQQQNIADAIDLLPRLATGIDVNIKFRRIDDFEFTPECAIFDLLDIPLYHGWLVDPQDDTVNAIGAKSYNTLMGELVALETRNMEGECKNDPEENSVDFAAATTATLGVPSPSLSRGVSFDDSPRSVSDHKNVGKGDMEEEVELLRALKLSEVQSPISPDGSLTFDATGGSTAACSTPLDFMGTIDGDSDDKIENLHRPEPNASHSEYNDLASSGPIPGEAAYASSKIDDGNLISHPTSTDFGVCTPTIVVENSSFNTLVKNDYEGRVMCNDVVEKASVEPLVQNEDAPLLFHVRNPISVVENVGTVSGGSEPCQDQSTSTSDIHEAIDNQNGVDRAELSSISPPNADSDSSSGGSHHEPDAFTSSVDGSEPIYEGEECILDSGITVYEDREPMYEGEVILAEQADKGVADACNVRNSKDELSPHQGELIRNFLKNNASQLTIYGLFCLLDGLKERELCVFFRNNHFSTMFKFDGELYLLATDQGYMNQPDLVWEKLNEVNGDTLFMTSNFKEFKVESHTNETWNEQNALTSTADYLASIDNSPDKGSNFNSDLQLAIALQQQEFEQQPQRQNLQQPATSSSSRLVTGPQVPRNSGRNSSLPPKQEVKQKEKCIVM